MNIDRETLIAQARAWATDWFGSAADLFGATLQQRKYDRHRKDAAYADFDASVCNMMLDEYWHKFVEAAELHSIDMMNAAAAAMHTRLVAIYVKAHDPGGSMYQKGVAGIVDPLEKGGYLRDLGHNAHSIADLRFWMETRLPAGTDIAAINPDGSFDFDNRTTATTDEMAEASRPHGYSETGWRALRPSASDFAEATAKRNRRRIAELENLNPHGANGITDENGVFRSFRDGQV
jgi:hypothetical protein